MPIDHKNRFYVEDNKSLNRFVSGVIKISEEYIRFLIYRGRISSLGNLSPFDTAVDLLAELFKVENGCLVYFKRHFEKLDTIPGSEEEYTKALKQFIYSATLNNLTHIYKLIDPVANKLLRNLKAAYRGENYLVTEIFLNKYVHKKDVAFASKECIDRDTLLNRIIAKNWTVQTTAKEFLACVFDVLESQDQYLQAISLNDLLNIYKELFAIKGKTDFIGEKVSSDIHHKLLFEEIRKGFVVKLNNYLVKKRFSEKERNCIYNIIDDVINCYLNGTQRDSVKELVNRYYGKSGTDSVCYRAEYAIGLLNSEIITLMQKEEMRNVERLSK